MNIEDLVGLLGAYSRMFGTISPWVVEEHFGADIDFAQLIKNYSPPTDGRSGLVPAIG